MSRRGRMMSARLLTLNSITEPQVRMPDMKPERHRRNENVSAVVRVSCSYAVVLVRGMTHTVTVRLMRH